MKTFFKFICASILALTTLMFVSCFSMEQKLSYNKGSYTYGLKITLSEAVLTLAGMDGDAVINQMKEGLGEIPENATFETIKDDENVGFAMSLKINENTTDESEQKLLPVVDKNAVTFMLLGGQAVDGTVDFTSEDGEMAKVMLEDAKWNFVVDKSIAKKVKKAVIFDSKNEKSTECEVSKNGNEFVISIPLVEVMQIGNAYDTLVITK